MKSTKKLVPKPKSKFLDVECKKCKEHTIVFSKSASAIDCAKCGESLVLPKGGHAIIKGRVKKVFV